ncbi:MAG TPA: amino acid permease [candidate division WOR-3 bacterium]|uniref:Amino acid permease n=1 Tax=candidate division WOR-3 bacterium TaxID=2052148 RepID=A0A7C0XE23_UNCW3|nr:amino acid permease [candidate division WOR-3 bacterium]
MDKMRKELGLAGVFSVAAGSMISSGLFVLPGIAYRHAGPGVILAYILAALAMLPAVLAKSELSTAMPKSGGSYFYIERSLGGLAGTAGGFSQWASVSLKSAFALIGIGTLFKLLFPSLSYGHIKLLALLFLLFFTAMNVLSVKGSGRLQILLVALLFILLLLFVGLGSRHVDVHRYVPFMPGGMKAVFFTSGLVFISYGGLTKVASVAEEVRNPSRNIPAGMMLAFFSVSLLYVAVVAVTVGVLDPDRLAETLTPISDASGLFLGLAGEVAISVAALLAFATTANAGILSSSRSLQAMSRDGWLPTGIKKLHPRFGTPYVAVLTTSLFMALLILLLDLEKLVEVASTVQLILFVMVNASLFIMRESKIVTYRPSFRAPLYPWIYVLSTLIYLVFIAMMGLPTLLTTLIFFAAALIWYWIYPRKGEKRRSALMYMVEKAADGEFRDSSLSRELREILMERDELVEDRFDRLVKRSPILDLKGSYTMEEFFRIASQELSPSLGVDPDVLAKKLLEREAQSHTVVRPGLAIPHIIVEGEGKFALLIARARDGISFSGEKEPVRAVFLMAGTRDERNFHLRALMAIASIAHEEDFERRWTEARTPEDLRNYILSSRRKRTEDGK